MPSVTVPRRRAPSRARSRPRPRNHSRSATVALVPGSTTRSGSPTDAPSLTKRRPTAGSRASASRSVKLAMRGTMTTATSRAAVVVEPGRAEAVAPGRRPARARESSASRATSWTHGSTPTVGTPQRRSRSASPVPSRAGSPRNLLTTKALTRALSADGSSSTVPYSEAKTPPRSMSPTTKAGKPAASATRRLTMSWSKRLISAGLPAPSAITTSKRLRRSARQSRTVVKSRGF